MIVTTFFPQKIFFICIHVGKSLQLAMLKIVQLLLSGRREIINTGIIATYCIFDQYQVTHYTASCLHSFVQSVLKKFHIYISPRLGIGYRNDKFAPAAAAAAVAVAAAVII